MHTLKEIVAKIEPLLNRLPAVAVRRVRVVEAPTITLCSISLTIASWESLLALNYCAQAANVPMHAWADYRPGSPEALADPARALSHAYQWESADPEDVRSRFEVLCSWVESVPRMQTRGPSP